MFEATGTVHGRFANSGCCPGPETGAASLIKPRFGNTLVADGVEQIVVPAGAPRFSWLQVLAEPAGGVLFQWPSRGAC